MEQDKKERGPITGHRLYVPKCLRGTTVITFIGSCPPMFATTARQEGKSAAADEPINTCGPATDHPTPKPSQADVHRIHEYMGKRLDYWLELEMLAQAHGVEKIVDAHAKLRGEMTVIANQLGRSVGQEVSAPWILQQIEKLQEAAKPIYVESPLMKLIPVYQALTRITEQLGLTVVNAHANAYEMLVQAICDEIQRLQEAAKPVDGESPLLQVFPAYKALQEIAEHLGYAIDINTNIQTLVTTLKEGINGLAGMQQKNNQLRKKINTLRGIVKYKAPHTPQCCPPAGKTCDCWKAEFMAAIEHMPENVSIAKGTIA